jgi:hypothetical protein
MPAMIKPDPAVWRSDCCGAPALGCLDGEGDVYRVNVWQAIGFCADCKDKATFHDLKKEEQNDSFDIIP